MRKTFFNAVVSDFWPILWRNLSSLVVIIIGSLSIILIVLGDKRDGFFLGIVILINVVVGIVQEFRARLSLEKLQAQTAQKYKINRKNRKLLIYSEQIMVGDKLSLGLGDQVPTDGVVTSSQSCECNEALLSGESKNIVKQKGDKVLAGSVIVAGSLILKVQKLSSQSYLSKMTDQLKLYSNNLSPIQKSLVLFIKIMATVLAVVAIIMLLKSYFNNTGLVLAISQIAAVAATIIAEGLILTSTLFFVYGALKLSRKKILLQQINAVESFGRVKTVCVDKTGTLTENYPVFEDFVLYQKTSEADLKLYLSSYLQAETSHTTTSEALLNTAQNSKKYKYQKYLAFSSTRKYGGIKIKDKKLLIFVGAPENFYKNLSKTQQKWLKEKVHDISSQAKRVIVILTATSGQLEDIKSTQNLQICGLAVLQNPLKKGTTEIVHFLQKRGISILVISGDNEKTVEAIAKQANIEFGNKILNSSQIETKTNKELVGIIKKQPLFARVLPSQKKKIVEAAQSFGLVAMIGDGANDALAIKTADVGIAMFSGASATRQVADAVLLNNSFADLPAAIELSDTVITTLEMIACLFFSRVWTGLFLLFSTLFLNINYPFSPRNISLINFFIIGFPIILWAAWPRHRERKINEKSFLERTLPFSIFNAFLISSATLIAYLGAHFLLSANFVQQSMAAYIVFLTTSIFTITLIPHAMQAKRNIAQSIVIWIGFVCFLIIISAVFNVSESANFFGVQLLPFTELLFAVAIGVVTILLQTIAVKFHLGAHFWQKLYKAFLKNNKNAFTRM